MTTSCDLSPQCGPQDTVHDPEAGNKGLYTSLLERLHTLYVRQGKSLCDECTASLSTNYRCEAGKIVVYVYILIVYGYDTLYAHARYGAIDSNGQWISLYSIMLCKPI